MNPFMSDKLKVGYDGMGQPEAKPLGQLKGIYYLKINGKYYIGKDVCIERMKRIKDHI